MEQMMRSFKEYLDEAIEEELIAIIQEDPDEEIVGEALTNAQRVKAKAVFRKNKSKIKRGKERAKRRIASTEKLKGRANKHARKEVEAKLLGGKKKADLSFGARSSLEKKVDKKKGLIARLAKKKLPSVRKADRAKKRT